MKHDCGPIKFSLIGVFHGCVERHNTRKRDFGLLLTKVGCYLVNQAQKNLG
jgi:hypothetical protein